MVQRLTLLGCCFWSRSFREGCAWALLGPRLLLGLTLTLALVTWCAAQSLQLPEMGDPAQSYLGPNEEQKLGLEIMAQLRGRGVMLDDALLSQYLSGIGQRIASQAEAKDTPFTFFMVRDSRINAFALPHNFIGINTGLLLATEREDELAGVLAHEIAHVTQHHIIRAIADMKRLALPMAAAMVAGAALAAASKQAGQAAMVSAAAATAQHQISFTRSNEQEADRVGMQLLARAGFDPTGMSRFFARLERWAGEDRFQLPELLRTHPRPESRAADTLDRVEAAPPPRRATPRDPQAYRLAKARAQVLTASDNAALIRELETRLAQATGPDAVATRYGYALSLRQAGRYAAAQQQVAELLRAEPDRLAFQIEAAELALARGDRAGGWRLFEQAQRLYPDDFALAMAYGRAIATQGDAQRALQILRPHLRRHPHDAPLYATYAQAAQRAGDLATTHATLAEYHYLNGEWLLAVGQLEQGLRQLSLSPYEQSQLRARLKQLRTEASARGLPLAPETP